MTGQGKFKGNTVQTPLKAADFGLTKGAGMK